MYYAKTVRDGKEITDISLNLAAEYYLLNETNFDEPIVLFFSNDNALIVGKNQNTYEEINTAFVEENNVNVCRRFSGGGAVYHDLGNLNFSFLTKDDGQSFRDFKKFTDPIIDALHKMGAKGAELRGRNDLVIDEKKFSGNAMYSKNGRLVAHGTMMFDSEIETIVQALKPKKHKLASKGVKSIRSRVTNIKPYLDEEFQNMDITEFRDKLIRTIFDVEDISDAKEYKLTDEDWSRIDEIAAEYTANWKWNYGESPQFDLERSERTSVGTVEVKLNVDKGVITDARIYGDFFGLGEISDVEEALKGTNYEKSSLQETLNTLDLSSYFGNIEAEELVDVIY